MAVFIGHGLQLETDSLLIPRQSFNHGSYMLHDF